VSEALSLGLDALLAASLLSIAALALFARERVTSVVFFLVFGLVLALVWARLGAPDVALAEAAIGAGLTGALLLDAVRRPRPDRPPAPAPAVRRVQALAAVALAVPVAVLLAAAAVGLGRSAGLGAAVDARLDEAGVSHPVTAVLLNFRSYDTLLEVAVLLVAALAVLALQPGEDLAAVPVPPPAEPVLQTLVRVAVPVSVVVAGWLLVLGSTGPGGAFQAGAVLAGALVLLRLTGHRSPAPGRSSLRLLLAAGTAVFLAVALGAAVLGAGLLDLDPAWAYEAVLLIEAALTVSIAVTLAELYVADQPAPRPEASRPRARPGPAPAAAPGRRRAGSAP
jgi:multisubunit Na+/H+ antiporter MnhB subunit